MRVVLSLFSITIFLAIPKLTLAETIQIEFTDQDSYSIEVALIEAGDTIEWLPTNEGHNVEFLAGPQMNTLSRKSEINALFSVVFKNPGCLLYHCTPHGNMGMLGLIVVDNDFHNLESVQKVQLSRVSDSVLKRLIRIAQSKTKS
jgi:pseudoazurin